MKDQLVKALALEGRVRLYLVRSTDLVEEARNRFDLNPTPTAALGRVLSVASIMGAMLKDSHEMLTININGGGPLGQIVVDAYPNGDVRGFVSNPLAEADSLNNGHLNVGAIVGNAGTLTVTKDLHMEDNWSGTVALQSGEIGEDFAYYFTLSEQTPTAVSVGVKVEPGGQVKAAGAMVLQMMPDATDTDISICEHVLSGLKPMSTIMEEYDDSDLSALAKDMFEDANVLSVQYVAFSCPCSKEKTERVLSSIAPGELQEMIDEDHGAEVTCNFCNTTYQFSEEELQKILDENLKNLAETKELEDSVDSGRRD
ncbi:Hsp33 family molecular chaperone HslO [Ileibacterium valens]|uniref:Hsp33 family molecular chaperone HslO n=1 Tax=Ileibacterium valens TaxID=1862668 RepID=UPI0024B930A4|nr:Hsp33 family molecular chaperone HslO [Ileibacterium valens]